MSAPVHLPPKNWWGPRAEGSFPWLGVLLFFGVWFGSAILLIAFFNWFNAKPWLFDEYRAGYSQGTESQNEGDCHEAVAREYPEVVPNASAYDAIWSANETKAFAYGCFDAVQGLDATTDTLAQRIRS